MVWWWWFINNNHNNNNNNNATSSTSGNIDSVNVTTTTQNHPRDKENLYTTTTQQQQQHRSYHQSTTTTTRRRRINYHLLSQSKERQKHLLRLYVRTNNLTRIRDYYESIQNHYYRTQQILERTQQVRLKSPYRSKRQQKRRPRQRRGNDNFNDVDDDDDSVHIMIDCGSGSKRDDDDDYDDDNNSCIPEDGATAVQRNNNHRNRVTNQADNPTPHPTTSDRMVHPRISVANDTVLRIIITNNRPTTTTTNPTQQQQQQQQQNVDYFAMASNMPTAASASSPVVVVGGGGGGNNNNGVLMSSPMSSSLPVYTMLDIDDTINPNETLHWTILYYACYHHQYNIVKYLMEECYASYKCTDRYHNTILHWICHYSLPTVPSSNNNNNTTTNRTSTSSSSSNIENINSISRSKIQKRLWNYYHQIQRQLGNNNTNNDTTAGKNPLLLLQYIMECAPTLVLISNNEKELPIHWLCQYGNNNISLLQCMIQFVLTNPYFHNIAAITNTSTTNSSTSCNRSIEPDDGIMNHTSSSSLVRRLLLDHKDQYHRTPIDVARMYHNDCIVQYLQSLLL